MSSIYVDDGDSSTVVDVRRECFPSLGEKGEHGEEAHLEERPHGGAADRTGGPARQEDHDAGGEVDERGHGYEPGSAHTLWQKACERGDEDGEYPEPTAEHNPPGSWHATEHDGLRRVSRIEPEHERHPIARALLEAAEGVGW